MTAATAVILATLTIEYEHKETRDIIGWFEYEIANSVRRFVPLYDESDRARAKKFWQKSWDGLAEDWAE